MSDITAARERLEDATDCSGAAREDDEMVVVRVGDLLAVLDGSTEEEVARAIAADFGVTWDDDVVTYRNPPEIDGEGPTSRYFLAAHSVLALFGRGS